jgi:hypothetical protein
MKSRFSNRRQWRDFVAAVQCSVNYSTVIGTLRSATKFFNYAWVRASMPVRQALGVADANIRCSDCRVKIPRESGRLPHLN